MKRAKPAQNVATLPASASGEARRIKVADVTDDEELNVTVCKLLGAKIISKQFHYGSRKGFKWAWNGDESTPCAYPGGGFYGFGWNERASTLELPDHILGNQSLGNMQGAVLSRGDRFIQRFNSALVQKAQHEGRFIVELTAKDWALVFIELLAEHNAGLPRKKKSGQA